MIDLTPLDVRKKRGDFRRILRGYEPEEVDTFLQLVAERMEELVKENVSPREVIGFAAGVVEMKKGGPSHMSLWSAAVAPDVCERAGRPRGRGLVRREAESDAAAIPVGGGRWGGGRGGWGASTIGERMDGLERDDGSS